MFILMYENIQKVKLSVRRILLKLFVYIEMKKRIKNRIWKVSARYLLVRPFDYKSRLFCFDFCSPIVGLMDKSLEQQGMCFARDEFAFQQMQNGKAFKCCANI